MDQLILSWPQVLAQEGEILFTTLAPRINVFSNLQRDTYRYAGLDQLMNQRMVISPSPGQQQYIRIVL